MVSDICILPNFFPILICLSPDSICAVRSFGTEDRETPFPVPAQSQTYDYILFRGSDIKDIRVVNSVVPNDPAIMQMSMPPSMGQQPFPQQGFHQMGQMGQFGYGPMGAIGGAMGGMGMNQNARGLSKPSELLLPTPVPPPDLSSAVEQPRSGDNGKVKHSFCSLFFCMTSNLSLVYSLVVCSSV